MTFSYCHSPFDVRRVLEHISNVLSVAGREQGRGAEHQEDSHADEHGKAELEGGGGSFLSYFLLVFKVVKIDGPSAAVPAPPPAPAPALLWPSLYQLLSCGLGLLKGIPWIKLGRYIDRRSNGGYCLILKRTHGLETASLSIAF